MWGQAPHPPLPFPPLHPPFSTPHFPLPSFLVFYSLPFFLIAVFYLSLPVSFLSSARFLPLTSRFHPLPSPLSNLHLLLSRSAPPFLFFALYLPLLSHPLPVFCPLLPSPSQCTPRSFPFTSYLSSPSFQFLAIFTFFSFSPLTSLLALSLWGCRSVFPGCDGQQQALPRLSPSRATCLAWVRENLHHALPAFFLPHWWKVRGKVSMGPIGWSIHCRSWI